MTGVRPQVEFFPKYTRLEKSNWRKEFYCFGTSSLLFLPACFQVFDNSYGISSTFQKTSNFPFGGGEPYQKLLEPQASLQLLS